MKKILVVLFSLTLIFAFTGCTSSNNAAAEDTENKTQEVVTSNTDDNDDNISNTENAVENANEKDIVFIRGEIIILFVHILYCVFCVTDVIIIVICI